MNQPLIQMEGIQKRFPGVHALNDCRFELAAGEVHALVGENGAGKSTMMKILTGVYQKDSGEIRLDGQPIDTPDTRASQNLGIGIIHQELNLADDLTVAQNIFIGRERRRFYGLFVHDEAMVRDTQALFDRMNLSVDPRARVGDLTVAKQQMVEIAKALSFDSKVLIMDEPTAALSNAEIDELFKIIEKLKQDQVGIVYISHRMEELKRITDRITVMRDGQYVDTVSTADTTVDTIISMMVGRQVYETAHPSNKAMRTETVLDVRGVSRDKVLSDITFQLKKGEILGFAGLMGAGRTEVARAIFGADSIDEGEIYIHGQKVKVRSPNDAVRYGIGYLSEDRKQFGLMTTKDVQSNIAIASLSSFSSHSVFTDDKKIADTSEMMVEKLKIKTPSINQDVEFLSGGNQQKVVIAKWLIRDCDILIFDEPTRGIDIGAKSEIYTLLNKLAEEGKSIIMISSELPEILRMSHRIIVMCEGAITGELDRSEATQESIMQYATLRKTATKTTSTEAI